MPNCCPTCVEEMYGSGIDPSALSFDNHLVYYADESDIPCSLNGLVSFSYLGVWVLPTAGDYELYRRKWNYVKNMYNYGYVIDIDGNWTDGRDEFTSGSLCAPADVPNVAYWLDYNKYMREFYEHLFDWTLYASSRTTGAAIFEKFVQWKFEIGSSGVLYGNLPQHLRNDHVGHCWMLCPYDSNNNIERTRALLGLGESEFPIEGRNDHGIYYMKTANRGPIWGFECSSPTCPYRTTTSGIYFYS
jgi:hypothetical protein